MKLLWLTWKDRKHPLAGGAETVNEALAERLAAEGHEVVMLVGGFRGGQSEEVVNGYRVVRLGNRFTVYPLAFGYYRKHLRGWPDLVIDEVNTMPFFAKFYVKEPNIALAYMLCRQIWFWQFTPPLSWFGYVLEPIYIKLLKDRVVLTESDSTRDELLSWGFDPDKVRVFPVGIDLAPVDDLSRIPKYDQPTLLSLGSVRPMKRTLDQIKAFELTKQRLPRLRLKIAGDDSGRYAHKLKRYIQSSPHRQDIEWLGPVGAEDRQLLMQKCQAILVTSVKEGWGLIVTEAASQGTPAVAYEVDGIRDSVRHGQTGYLADRNTPAALAEQIVKLLSEPDQYQSMRREAWQHSLSFTHDRSYQIFLEALWPLARSSQS